MSANQTAKAERLTGHEYDGIREYDNPTPGWWHAILLASVVFSVGYYVFWEYSPLASSIHDDWNARQVAYYKQVFGQLGELKPDQDTILSMMKNEQMLAVAQGIFEGNCAACHAANGGAAGLTGVNLTDDAYKNVKSLPDILSVITKGANAGAMPAWENRLSQNERIIVAAYAANLRGRNVAGGKAPEGEVPPPWPAPGR